MKLCIYQFGLLALLLSMLIFPVAIRAQAGMPLVPIVAEQALLIDHGDQVELIISFTVAAAGPNAVILLPVPGAPTAAPFPEGAQLLDYLAEATRPVIQVEPRSILGIPPLNSPAPTATPSPVPAVPGALYQVVTFAPTDAGQLADWFVANNVLLAAADQGVLNAHTAAGGGIVALTFSEPLPAGRLLPLQIRYSAGEPTYSRTAAPVPLDLFVLASGRSAAAGFETFYAGPIAELADLPPTLSALLPAAAYLTHLHNSGVTSISSAGITLQPAISAAPLRRTLIVQEEIYLFERSSTTIGLGLVACTSLLALVGAVAMRRRLDAINPDS